jgi:tyrosinase
VGDKDVQVAAFDSAGTMLGSISLMVRVRKNAETLEANEREEFLETLVKLHDLKNGTLASEYRKFSRTHDEAFFVGIHGAPSGLPLFLAWHRAFLLNLERELQVIDPRIALPYWRFDQPAPKVFSPDFMGSVSGQVTKPGGFLVDFSPSNPLSGWNMGDGNGPLVRVRDASGAGALPADRLANLFSVGFNSEYGGLNGSIEDNYHNGAHSRIGGWLATAASPRDPLFFLLHANVDRAWAEWQSRFDRFDSKKASSYSAQGSYPGPTAPGRFPKASYRDDQMWPWNGSGGNQGTPDPLDDWPGFAYPMPPGISSTLGAPTPGLTVDYLDTAGAGLGLGVCYDDIGFPAAIAGPA